MIIETKYQYRIQLDECCLNGLRIICYVLVVYHAGQDSGLYCTLHSTLYTLFYTLHYTTLYTTLYSLHYTLHYTLHFTLYSTRLNIHQDKLQCNYWAVDSDDWETPKGSKWIFPDFVELLRILNSGGPLCVASIVCYNLMNSSCLSSSHACLS